MNLSIDYYLETGHRNLSQMSRTAQGTLDLSASADKAAKVISGLSGESAAEIAVANYDKAIKYAFGYRNERFFTASTLRHFIEELATIANSGILKHGVLIRSGADSTKYPYTRVADLEAAMKAFYQALHYYVRELPTGFDPRIVAAFIEWNIDLRGHFFADGCGKSAKLASSWFLMRTDSLLPDYTNGGKIPLELARDVYYGNNPQDYIRTDSPLRDGLDFYRFCEYYLSLF